MSFSGTYRQSFHQVPSKDTFLDLRLQLHFQCLQPKFQVFFYCHIPLVISIHTFTVPPEIIIVYLWFHLYCHIPWYPLWRYFPGPSMDTISSYSIPLAKSIHRHLVQVFSTARSIYRHIIRVFQVRCIYRRLLQVFPTARSFYRHTLQAGFPNSQVHL